MKLDSFKSFMDTDYQTLKSELLDPSNRPDAYWGDLDLEVYGFAYAHTRDSSLIEESNWDTLVAEMQKYCSEYTDFILCNHWACGWVEYLMVNTEHKRTMFRLHTLLDKLESYPILDEDDLSSREWDQAYSAYDSWARFDVGKICVRLGILLDEYGDFEPTDYQEDQLREIVANCILNYNPDECTFRESDLTEVLRSTFGVND